MLRRRFIALLIVVALPALAAAGIAGFRVPLVAWLVERQLAGLGAPNPRLTVEQVGWRETRITAIEAGRAGELALAELIAGYRPSGILRGRLERLSVKGLALRLDLTGEGPMLGGLQAPLEALLSGADEGAGSDRRLPQITLARSRVEARTPLGPATLELDGRVGPQDGGGIGAELDLVLSGSSGRLLGRLRAAAAADGRITGGLQIDRGALAIGDGGFTAETPGSALSFEWREARLQALKCALRLEAIRLAGADLGTATVQIDAGESRLSADGRLGTGKEGFELKFEGRIDDYLAAPKLELRLEGLAHAAAPVWRLLPLPPPAAGGASLRAAFEAGPPAGPMRADRLGRLLASGVTGGFVLELDKLAWPGGAGDLNAILDTRVKPRDGGLDLSVMLDAGLGLQGLPAEWLAAAGLPPGLLGERAKLRLGEGAEKPLTIRLEPAESGAGFEVRGSARLFRTDELDLAARGRLSGTLDRALTMERLSFDGLELSAVSRSLPGTPVTGLRFAGDLSGDLTAVSSRHEIRVAASELSFHVKRKESPPLTVQGAFDRLVLSGAATGGKGYRGTAVLENGRFTLPELAVAVEGLSLSAPLDEAGPSEAIRFRAAAIKDLNQPANFHPLAVAGKLEPRDARFAVTAEITGTGKLGRVAVTGWLDPAGARGELRGHLAPLVFTPAGKQPSGLSPWLAKLARVAGKVEGDARIAWDPAGQRSQATIALEDLSFELDGIPVGGLRLGLRLDDLPSPASPPAQKLFADKLDLGFPLEDIAVRFRLLAGETPRLLVERAEFTALGGRFRLDDTLFDPSRPRQALELQVVELELADLFDALRIEGLTGRGRIGGVLPMTIGPEGVAMPDAALAERSPGNLRFHSPAAAQALQSGGEPVTLALQALEDFRYETLKLTGGKAADGEVGLRIALQGTNPEVLDGRPFRFNINLTGNLNPLLAALIEGRRLSSDLLRKTWRLQP